MIRRRNLLNAAARLGTTLLVVPTASAAISASAASAVLPPKSGDGFFGLVTSSLDGRPVAGATISVPSLGHQATSDGSGQYALAAPPGNYLVRVTAGGFVGAIRPDQSVRDGYTSLAVDLVPLATSEAEQEAIYAKVVQQMQAPLVSLPTRPLAVLNGSFSLPSYITVRYDNVSPPNDVQVPLEDYVKGVIPNEVSPSWPAEALKAQAVASRSYGVASYLATGYVYPDTRSQVYNPDSRTTTTDAAADATAGQVLSYAGAVITAFFFSRCNGLTTCNSENHIAFGPKDPGGLYTCTTAVWNKLSYCRARSCTGHSPSTISECGYYGHGVGMCQWGSYYQATIGAAYDAILASYYTSTNLENAIGTPTPLGPFLVLHNQGFTIRWASVGSGANYSVSVQSSGGSTVASYNGSGTSCGVGPLATGAYTWGVVASLNGQNSNAQATIHVADQVSSLYLPAMSR